MRMTFLNILSAIAAALALTRGGTAAADIPVITQEGEDATAVVESTVTAIPPNNSPFCVASVAPLKCGINFPSGGQLLATAVERDYVCLTLDGSGSSDPDGDSITINWVIDGTNLLSGDVVINCLDAGCHTVAMLVSDGLAPCVQSFEVCVIAPSDSEMVEQLIRLVDNMPLERKNKRPLLVSLKAAQAVFDGEGRGNAAAMLRAFQRKVRAQVAHRNPAEAALIIQAAQDILDSLGCDQNAPQR